MKTIIFLIMLVFSGMTIQPVLSIPNSGADYNITESIMGCNAQPNLDLADHLRPLLEKMGVEIDELKVMDMENMADCTITIKGTYNGKKVELTITFKDISCAELLKQLS